MDCDDTCTANSVELKEACSVVKNDYLFVSVNVQINRAEEGIKQISQNISLRPDVSAMCDNHQGLTSYPTSTNVISTIPVLIYLEVFPLQLDDNNQHDAFVPELTSASAKIQLIKQTISSVLDASQDQLHFRPTKNDITSETEKNISIKSCSQPVLQAGDIVSVFTDGTEQSIIHLQQANITLPKQSWPCRCRGYMLRRTSWTSDSLLFYVTDATYIKIHPFENSLTTWKDELTGEFPERVCAIDRHVMCCQNQDAVRDLKMRILSILNEPVLIGTTADAVIRNKVRELERSKLKKSMQSFMRSHDHRNSTVGSIAFSMQHSKADNVHSRNQIKLSFQDSSLLVHSPHHGAGKTALVTVLARHCCTVVHVLRPGPILAKFGIYADSALECIIHDIALVAAVKNQSIAIILDDLDAFIPGSNSAILNGNTGDAAVPILSASHAFLRSLNVHLQRDKEIPFPVKTPLYNINGKGGCVLPVRLCLIAIVTCPDDGYRLQIRRSSSSGSDRSMMTMFDTMVSGRFRLPDLTPITRLRSFHFALAEGNVSMSDELIRHLPLLAASALWARGSVFKKVANIIQSRKDTNEIVSLQYFTSILDSFSKSENSGSTVQFVVNSNDTHATGEIFQSIGGNVEAKLALVDALGTDAKRNARLKAFGMSRPSGILLYGPPGTGKTLIAKSVASLIQSKSSSIVNMGGAFITVNSTDIAQAEVGSGEKTLVSAFEAARRNSPSVIFIDEFQALFTDRASGGSGRLSTTLFQCMDNLNQWRQVENTTTTLDTTTTNTTEKIVIVLAATNTPWMIEKAFLRTGRFDRVVHVDLPGHVDRISIFRLYISSMQLPSEQNANEIDDLCTRLANVTVGFSGADIAALCRAAAVRCLLCKGRYVKENYFWDALELNPNPSSSKAFVSKIANWHP